MGNAILDYSFIEDQSASCIEVVFRIKGRAVGVEFRNEDLKKSLLKRDDHFLLALFQSQEPKILLTQIYREPIHHDHMDR